jgi:DNA-binding MarR family transcriptional regulator
MPNNHDLRNLLTYRIVALSRDITYFNQRNAIQTKDLNIPEMRILSLCFTLGKCNQTNFVKNALHGDPGNISRYISKLENKGYLKSTKDKKDKRLKWLKLTAKGKKTAEKYIHSRQLHNKKLTSQFTKSELIQFEELLSKTAEFYSAH